MNFWTYLHAATAVVYFFSFFYVLNKDFYSLTNWILAFVFLCLAVWSAGSALIFNSLINCETAAFILKIQSLGWIFFVFFYFLFLMIFTGRNRLLRSPLLYIGGFGLSVFFIYCVFTGKMITCCAQTPYGLTSTWNDNWYVKAFFAYYILLFITASVSLVYYRVRQKGASNAVRRITDIMIASVLFCFFSGTISSVILKSLHVHVALETDITMIVLLYALIYSAEKYDLFEMNAVKVADTIFESVQDGIVLMTGDGTISQANENAAGMFETLRGAEGLKMADVIGLPALAEAIRSGVNFHGREFEIAGHGKENTTFFVSVFPVIRDKKVIGRICMINDITERKKAEKDIMDTITKLTWSNDELENFAHVVSHDIKEPARTASLYIELIKSKSAGLLTGDEKDELDTALYEAGRFRVIIDGILKYSRLRRENFNDAKIGLNEIYGDVCAALAKEIKSSGAEIILDEADKMPRTIGDKKMLAQLFINLVDNALKFKREDKPVIRLGAAMDGGYIIFSVADNGIGIKSEYFTKIFEMFERLHGRGQFSGEGIGLALCSKIAELHGGKIWAENGENGVGSVFKVRLPAAE